MRLQFPSSVARPYRPVDDIRENGRVIAVEKDISCGEKAA